MDQELINKKLQENIPLTDEENTFLSTNAQDGNFLPPAQDIQSQQRVPAQVSPEDNSSIEQKQSHIDSIDKILQDLKSSPKTIPEEKEDSEEDTSDEKQPVKDTSDKPTLNPSTEQPVTIDKPQYQKGEPVGDDLSFLLNNLKNNVSESDLSGTQQPQEIQPAQAESEQAKPVQQPVPPTQAPPVQNKLVPQNESYGPGLSDAALAQAQDQVRQSQLLGGLAIAGAQIGGMGHSDVTPAQKILAQANQPVENILARRKAADEEQKFILEKDRNNPNSPAAKILQQFIKEKYKLGLDDAQLGKLSVASIEHILGPVNSFMTKEEQRKSNEILKNNAQNEKNKTRADQYTQKLGDSLDETRRNPVMAQRQMVIDRAQAMEMLVAPETLMGDLGKVDPQRYAELVAALDYQISRGNPAIERFRHLMPDNVNLTGSKILQWLTSKPQAAEQKQFISNIMRSSETEKATAKMQLMDAYLQKAYTTGLPVKQLDPDRFYNMVSTKTGIPSDEIKALETKDGTGYDRKQFQITPENVLKHVNPNLLSSEVKNKLNMNQSNHTAKAGDIVNVKGKQFKVAPDGDTLIPVQ